MGQFAALKKIGSKIWGPTNWVEKIRPGLFFYSEREELAWPLLFSCKQKKYDPEPQKIGLISYRVQDPRKRLGRPDKLGCRLTGRVVKLVVTIKGKKGL